MVFDCAWFVGSGLLSVGVFVSLFVAVFAVRFALRVVGCLLFGGYELMMCV